MAYDSACNSSGFFTRQDGLGWGDAYIQTTTAASTAIHAYGVQILRQSAAGQFVLEQPVQKGIDVHLIVQSTNTITVKLGSSMKCRIDSTRGASVLKFVNPTTAAYNVAGYWGNHIHLRAMSSKTWARLSTPESTASILLSTAT